MNYFYESLADIENNSEYIKNKYILSNEFTVPSHYHDGIEVLSFFNGSGYAYLNGKRIHVKEGEILIVNSKEIHSIVTDKILEYYYVIIKKSFLKKHNFPFKEREIKRKITDDELSKYCYYICEEKSQHSNWDDKKDYAFLILLTIKLFSEYLYKSKKIKNISNNISNKTDIVINVMDYISDNIEKNFSLEELATNLGYSKYYLCRIFKDLTQQTIIEYTNRLKCTKAMNDLKTSKSSVYEVAQKYGYDNFSYFSKTFKKYNGNPPSSFSKNKIS